MTRTIPESARELADLALAVYVEELAGRRRVLFVGDPASAVLDRLAQSARSVEVVSPRSRSRSSRKVGRIPPRPWPGPQETGAWDLVLVPDLLWAGPPRRERIAEMATWLTPRGALVAAAEEREDGIAYEALYEILSGAFPQVRMLGQAPFSAWALVDFAPAVLDPEITFDGSLLEGRNEDVMRYVALCGARDVRLDAFSIVQVPAPLEIGVRTEGRQAQPDERDAAMERDRERSEALAKELAEARARRDEVERKLERAIKDARTASADLESARGHARSMEEALAEARNQIELLQNAEPPVDEDHARLEAQLAERAKEITGLRGEVERRALLVRDLVEELNEARAAAAPIGAPAPVAPEIEPKAAELEASLEEARASRDALDRELRSLRERTGSLEDAIEVARARAVEAEASVTATAYKLDEARAALALCQRERESEREAAATAAARAHGTVRGLSARLAEVDELRMLGEARLSLAEDDLVGARERIRRLEREVEESREQLELAMMRAQGRPGERESLEAKMSSLERGSAEKEGRLYGELIKARESASELLAERRKLLRDVRRLEGELREARETLDRTRADLETRLGQVADEAAQALAEVERHGREATSLRARLSERATEVQTLTGEREGLRLRLQDAEAALEAQRAAPAAGEQRAPDEALAELSALREKVAALARSLAEESERANEASERASRESKRADDVAVRVSTRDAVIGRLQAEVSDALARHDALVQRASELERDLRKAREDLESSRAVSEVRADEERREVRRLEQTVRDLQSSARAASLEHEETRAALAEARHILAQMATGLDIAPSAIPSAPSDSRYREQLAQLQRELDDREIMMRSITAQLQDRDDRIRALERLREEEAEESQGDVELREQVLQATERAARLERELEQERLARRAAEAGGAPELESELRRLNQAMGDRDAQLMLLEGRVSASEREGRTMRETFAQARASLETLLAEIANDQRAEAADRIASLLRVLRRF